MIQDGQKFVIRMNHRTLKRYSNHPSVEQDKTFEVNFTCCETNDYRNNWIFWATLMSTYPLRFVKIPLHKQSIEGMEGEVFLTNITPAEFSSDDLNEVYLLRWGIETAYNELKKTDKIRGV